ncbi:MAG: hypothetical protein JXA68_02145 [Ignavibacteriales bacterium]|nr:hypothetical protein [Ignavibacteriales bacterium]
MRYFFIPVLFIALIYSCTQVTLEPVDYSWPLESILDIDANGVIKDQRFALIINTKALIEEEKRDNTNIPPNQIRIIRNKEGFYFMTADGFKNVYVFKAGVGSLELENKILITDGGLNAPAFNQRPPYIELLNGNEKIKLNHEGIVGEK